MRVFPAGQGLLTRSARAAQTPQTDSLEDASAASPLASTIQPWQSLSYHCPRDHADAEATCAVVDCVRSQSCDSTGSQTCTTSARLLLEYSCIYKLANLGWRRSKLALVAASAAALAPASTPLVSRKLALQEFGIAAAGVLGGATLFAPPAEALTQEEKDALYQEFKAKKERKQDLRRANSYSDKARGELGWFAAGRSPSSTTRYRPSRPSTRRRSTRRAPSR